MAGTLSIAWLLGLAEQVTECKVDVIELGPGGFIAIVISPADP